MKKIIYDYDDYKSYINDKINNSPSKGRGIKLKISEYLSCQTAFISQVLNGQPNFSLEQGIKLNKFFDHTKDESRFFILLLQYSRAGSAELIEFFKNEMKDIIEKRSIFKDRINIKSSLKKIDQQVYYSNWLYTCIHIMVSIPGLQTPLAISRQLNIPREKVTEIMTFLEETGLIQKIGSQYEIGVTKIFLAKDSDLIQRHHTNWRIQAMRSIDINDFNDFHYSSIVSMSKEDVPRIKEILIRTIEQCRVIIQESKEEKVQSLCIDLFGI